nr:MAG: replication initiation protein [Microvirus sp.]
MPCYHPMLAYYPESPDQDGNKKLTFHSSAARGTRGYLDSVTLPCGQCIGCRLEKSRQWAIRCHHEAQMHEQSSFLTLTYDNQHLPPDGTLIKKDFQDFMKRLRKQIPQKLRYYHCGEYGEQTQRPHYHALLFGYDFPDKMLHSENHREEKLYTSDLLRQTWGKGHCLIGEVTFDSAAYVARYCMKKVNGKNALDHYTTSVDLETGLINTKQPEYSTMSLKPGIGRTWLDKYQSDVYPSDEVIINTKAMKPPKYYDNVYEIQDPENMGQIKRDRYQAGIDSPKSERHSDRLKVKEKIKQIQTKSLLREN